jgi:hypothetical protein
MTPRPDLRRHEESIWWLIRAEGIRALVRNRDLALFIGLGIAQTFTRGALTVSPLSLHWICCALASPVSEPLLLPSVQVRRSVLSLHPCWWDRVG